MDNKNLAKLQISELELLNETLEKNQKINRTNDNKSKMKKNFTMTIIVIISLVLLFIINFSLDVYQSYISISSNHQYIAFLYLFIYFTAVAGIIGYIIYSIRSYINLKDAFQIQEQTLNAKSYDDEKEIALLILDHYKTHHSLDMQDKAKFLYDQVKSNSLHSPFTSIKLEIVDSLDKEATSTVYSSAKEVSLFTAFSPGSALDSIVVIFSSIKLMKKIFFIYGYKTNLFTSLLIIRKILENASIAALVEYADDSVNDLLGNTLISKLSTKMAQGIGNGVLMLRIGNIIIQSARPFASDGSIGSYKHMVELFIKYIKEKVGKK